MTWFDRLDRLDDRAVDSLLSGSVPRGGDDLTDVAVFAHALADEAAVSPRPSAELAALFVEGLSPAEFDAVAPSASRQPNKGKRTVLETALAKLASLGLAAKTSVAGATVLAVTTLGVGAAGALPGPVQETAADVVSAVSPFEIPRPDAAPADAGAPDDVKIPTDGDPEANDHGQTVSGAARGTKDEGCERGHAIATLAGGDPGECVDGTGVGRAGVPAHPGLDTAAERAADEAQQHLDAAGDAGRSGRDTAADASADAPRHDQQPADAGQSGRDTAADAADASGYGQDDAEQPGSDAAGAPAGAAAASRP